MLNSRRRGASVGFLTSEGVVGTQNEAGDTGGAQVDNNEGVKGDGKATKGRRKRDRFRKAIRGMLGKRAKPVPGRLRKRLSKTRPKDAGVAGPVLDKTEDEQPPMASGALQAS